MRNETRLNEFLASLWAEAIHPRPRSEEWLDLIRRLKSGGNQRITRKTFWYFLEVLPPQYLARNYFAFAEGREPLRLFAFLEGRYVVRQLTWEETITFCTLAEIPLPH